MRVRLLSVRRVVLMVLVLVLRKYRRQLRSLPRRRRAPGQCWLKIRLRHRRLPVLTALILRRRPLPVLALSAMPLTETWRGPALRQLVPVLAATRLGLALRRLVLVPVPAATRLRLAIRLAAVQPLPRKLRLRKLL